MIKVGSRVIINSSTGIRSHIGMKGIVTRANTGIDISFFEVAFGDNDSLVFLKSSLREIKPAFTIEEDI
jgi:hypothetical protein